jgi:hypothetical protein
MGDCDAIAYAGAAQALSFDQALKRGMIIQPGISDPHQGAQVFEETFLAGRPQSAIDAFRRNQFMQLHGHCVLPGPVLRGKDSVLVFLFRRNPLVMVTGFFLVFDYLPVQLVGKKVDCRVHIVAVGIRMDLCPLCVNGALGQVPVLFHQQDDVGAGDMIEMTVNAANLLVYIAAQGIGDVYVLAGYRNLHLLTPEKMWHLNK